MGKKPSNESLREMMHFYSKVLAALFATLVLLVGWVSAQINAGEFGIMVQIGAATAIGLAITCWRLYRTIIKLIKRLRGN